MNILATGSYLTQSRKKTTKTTYTIKEPKLVFTNQTFCTIDVCFTIPCRFAPRYTVPGPHFIGRKNKKAIYREFTSGEFTEQKQRTTEEEHLGIMGPMIKAEVGDTIEVVFKNLATKKYSIHPHGILYR